MKSRLLCGLHWKITNLFFFYTHHGGQTKHSRQAECGASTCSCASTEAPPRTHLPALDVGLQLLQRLQLLHLPLGLVDVGAHGLHGLQGALHRGVVRVLARSPLGQLLEGQGRTGMRDINSLGPRHPALHHIPALLCTGWVFWGWGTSLIHSLIQ